MDDFKSVVKQSTYKVDYGQIHLKLPEILQEHGLTRNRLASLTGVKYEIIDRYYKERIERVDMDLLAKICYVLNCQISDLLEYFPPQNS